MIPSALFEGGGVRTAAVALPPSPFRMTTSPTTADPRDTAAPADKPSKTQRKKASHDLQALGEAVVALPDSRLDALAVPAALLDAIREARRIRSHEALRRQMQYIGKLMRGVDPEPLRDAVAAAQLGRARDAIALHRAEAWRAELVAGDDALARWSADHPDADLQQLRSLVRAARKDASAAPEQRSGRAYRELFRWLREHAGEAATEETGDG